MSNRDEVLSATFEKRKDAVVAMAQAGMGENDFQIKKIGNDPQTWAVVEIDKASQDDSYQETYHRVIFAGRGSENDPIDVQLCVNGEVLVVARLKETILPRRFLTAADHTTFEKFFQEPGKLRKSAGTTQRFPYTMLGEATEEEYILARRAGTEEVKRNIARYGFDVGPEGLA